MSFTRSLFLVVGFARLRTCYLISRYAGSRLCQFSQMYRTFKQSRSPLVSVEWLAEAISNNLPNMVVLDVSMAMPGEKRDCRSDFLECHIPGARFLDMEECVEKETDNEHMLPSHEVFARTMSMLGVSNTTKVIVYDSNQRIGMFSSPRAWYMLTVFGHPDICILDGGLNKWKSANLPIETGESTPFDATNYVATFQSHRVKSMDEVMKNIQEKSFTLVDARSEGRFHGTAPEPRPLIKPGHVPGAANLFWVYLIDPQKKTFQTKYELSKLFEAFKIDMNKPVVAMCGSGVTGCFIVLGAHILGYVDVPLYDGSWCDWYLHAPEDLKEEVPKN